MDELINRMCVATDCHLQGRPGSRIGQHKRDAIGRSVELTWLLSVEAQEEVEPGSGKMPPLAVVLHPSATVNISEYQLWLDSILTLFSQLIRIKIKRRIDWLPCQFGGKCQFSSLLTRFAFTISLGLWLSLCSRGGGGGEGIGERERETQWDRQTDTESSARAAHNDLFDWGCKEHIDTDTVQPLSRCCRRRRRRGVMIKTLPFFLLLQRCLFLFLLSCINNPKREWCDEDGEE